VIFVQKAKKREVIPVRWMLFKYGALSSWESEAPHSLNTCRLQNAKANHVQGVKKKNKTAKRLTS